MIKVRAKLPAGWTGMEFVEACLDAVARVPLIYGHHLPVVVLIHRADMSRAIAEPWLSGSFLSVSGKAAEVVARDNPRAYISDDMADKEEDAAAEWGEELIGILMTHPRATMMRPEDERARALLAKREIR